MRELILAEYVRSFAAGGYRVDTVVESRCATCDGRTFRVEIDEEESTRRTCIACGTSYFIGDSADHWDEDSSQWCACPCGGAEFAVAVGYSLMDGGEVRWMSVGMRCLADDAVGVYADVKIDYTPSRHLLDQA